MKWPILAGILAAIVSLFTPHPQFAYHAPIVPAPAAAAAAVSLAVAQEPQAPESPPNISASSSEATTTIVNQYITEPAISRPDQTSGSYVTEDQFNAGLSMLGNSLQQLISESAGKPDVSGVGAPLSVEAFAPSQAIDNLSGVTITNANLTASEIPSNIVASNYLPLSGGTLTGTLNVPTLNASTTLLSGFSTANATSTNFFATNATATNLVATNATTADLSVSGALNDLQGTSQYVFNSWAPRLWQLSDGTSLNPVTTPGATFKISRTEAVASTTCNGNNVDNECNAALLVESNSSATAASSSMQTAAIVGDAKGEPIGTDVVGITGIGDVIGMGTGIGTGAYIEGRRDTATGKALGAEVRVSNQSSNPGVYNPNGFSDTQGLWITGDGAPSAAAIAVGDITPFITGLSFTTGSVATTTIEDNSSAVTSLQINGTHTYGILVGPNAGNVGLGTLSPTTKLDVAGAINATTGFDQNESLVLYASSTNLATQVGLSAGGGFTSTSTALYDTAVGYGALSATPLNASANQNTAIGFNALTANTLGQYNNAFGAYTLSNNTSGVANMGFGYATLKNNTSGSNNVAIGIDADYYNQIGAANVAIGNYSDGQGSGSVASHYFNTAIGNAAGTDISTGGKNLFLGANTASTTASGSNNIALGYDIALPSTNGSNQLDIGNLIFGTGINGEGTSISTGNVGTGTSTPYSRLEVWGPDTASTSAFVVANNASTTEFAVYDTGNATLAGGLIQNSDQRLKTNIQSLNASSSLSLIDELNPVTFNWIDPNKGSTLQLGFIAQEVQSIFPSLVSTTSPTALTPDGTLSLNYIDLISPIVSAVQEISKVSGNFEMGLIAWLGNASNGIVDLFAANGHFSNELCVGTTCVTPAQFQAMVAAAVASQGGSSQGALTNNSQATDTPPVIQINGSNPATIQVGATYNDLGATITGPTADLNLDIETFVNGAPMSPVQIDTSAAATDAIDYVVTDQNGLTSTSTRTVIIQAPAAPSAVTASASSSAAISTPQ